MAQATGLFGSGVGSRVSQKPKPARTLPAGVMKIAVPHIPAPPSFHTPASTHLTQTQMTGGYKTPDTSWSSSMGSGFTGASSSGGLGQEIFGGVEGFIGHLGSDIIHTAMGMPAGIAYMIEHPIAGAEMAVKATWQDWSPLFHGDVRLWLHNTWEHPLAPILDVASVMTGGAALSARTAAIAGAVGEASAAAAEAGGALTASQAALTAGRAAVTGSALVKTGSQLARVTKAITSGAAPTAVSTARVVNPLVDAASVAGRASGAASEGIAASEWWQHLQRYASPAQYAAKQYEHIANKAGFHGDEAIRFVNQAMSQDRVARRIYDGAAGTGSQMHKSVSDNPWTRYRQGKLRGASEAIGKAHPMLGKVLGESATFERLMAADKGTRRAAMGNVIHRQLTAVAAMGKAMVNLLPHEWLAKIEPGMFDGLVAQAHEVAPVGAVGSPELQAQLDKLAEGGLQAVRSLEHRGPALDKAYQNVIAKGDVGVNDFLKTDWSTASVTNKAHEVFLDGNGNLRMVSRPEQIGAEVRGSSKVAQLLYTNPTAVWKWMILGASPRYFVNNFVGNSLMLLAATDPVSMGRAFHGYLKAGRTMDKAFNEMYTHLEKNGATAEELQTFLLRRQVHGRHWMDKWFAGEYGFGESNRIHPGGDIQDVNGTGFIGKMNSKYSLHHITNKYADMPQRYMALQYSMKRIPEYQRAYANLRARGASHWYAEQRAADMAASSPAVRAIVRQQVHHMLGQYHTFNKVERGIRTVVPFYAWDRAIAVHMKELITQSPYKVAMGAAIGTIGGIKLQQIMGSTPDFLQSAIPAKLMTGPLGILAAMMGGKLGQRENVLMAQGLNPYASVADLTKTVGAMLPGGAGLKGVRVGDSLGGQLNPLIQNAVQQLTGTSMQSGAPVGGYTLGPIAGVYQESFASTPQFNMLNALLGMEGGSTTKTGKDTLYAHTLAQQVSSWLGVPIRQVSIPAANALADKQMKRKHYKNNMSTPGL